MDAQGNAYQPPQGELITPVTTFNQPKFLALSGRIGRLRYLAYISGLSLLYYLALMVIALPMMRLLGNHQGTGVFGVAAVALYLPMLVFTWAYAVRRLNDMNQNGWLSLLLLIPLVNFIMALYLLLGRGNPGDNRYGPPPPPNTTGVIILGSVMPVIMIIGILAAIALPAYQSYTLRARAHAMQMQTSPSGSSFNSGTPGNY